jgi:hypothetical protein
MHTTGNYNSSNDNDYTESLLGASSDNDSELMTTTSTQRRQRKGKNSEEKTSNKKGKHDDGEKKTKKNDCPHCKKRGQKRPHPNTPHNKCIWNKAYKVWRPRLICDELEVDFKPRSKFSVDLGGWPELDE